MVTADGWRQEEEDTDDDLSKGPGLFVLPLRLWLYGDVRLVNSSNYVQQMVKNGHNLFQIHCVLS